MKRILYSLLMVAVSGGVASCNLDLAPENTLVTEITYKTENTALAALMGAYVGLNTSVSGIGNQNQYANSSGYLFAAAEIGTPNVIRVSKSPEFQALDDAQYTPEIMDGIIKENYRSCYNTIDLANNIIKGITEYGEFSQKMEDQFIAEAKFIRAYTYMVMLQAFGDGALTGDMKGLGLVLKTTPYESYIPGETVKRAPVSEVYELIISDLKEYNKLQDVFATGSNAIRASKGVAYAMLSRVYLYRGSFNNVQADMDSSARYAGLVTQTGKYSLQKGIGEIRNLYPSNLFVENATPESETKPTSADIIFMQPSWGKSTTMRNSLGGLSYYNKGVYINPVFVNSMPANDLRGNVTDGLIFKGGSNENAPVASLTTFKYNNSDGYNAVLYMRYTEVMLNRAEALVRSSSSVHPEAAQIVNTIHKRFNTDPNLEDITFSSWQTLLDSILVERNRELCFEGHTRWDLIRTGRKLKDASIPANRMILPIPEDEIRITNGQVEQNTGFR